MKTVTVNIKLNIAELDMLHTMLQSEDFLNWTNQADVLNMVSTANKVRMACAENLQAIHEYHAAQKVEL